MRRFAVATVAAAITWRWPPAPPGSPPPTTATPPRTPPAAPTSARPQDAAADKAAEVAGVQAQLAVANDSLRRLGDPRRPGRGGLQPGPLELPRGAQGRRAPPSAAAELAAADLVDDARRLRRHVVASSYEMSPSLTALSAILEADGISDGHRPHQQLAERPERPRPGLRRLQRRRDPRRGRQRPGRRGQGRGRRPGRADRPGARRRPRDAQVRAADEAQAIAGQRGDLIGAARPPPGHQRRAGRGAAGRARGGGHPDARRPNPHPSRRRPASRRTTPTQAPTKQPTPTATPDRDADR